MPRYGMKLIAPVFAAVFGACVPSHTLHVEPQHLTHAWGPAMAHILASDTMSPQCTASVMAGVVFFRGLGAPLDLTFVDDDHPAIALEPRRGEIAMRVGFPTTPGAAAETEVWFHGAALIDRAAIVFGVCDAWTVVHETGHALGLEHSPDPMNIMYYSTEHRGWGVDDEQIRWVHVD